MWIPDHVFIFFTIAEQGIFGHLLALLIQSTADLYHSLLGEVTDADRIMHPQHFGTDLTAIRIRINPKIRIRIPENFSLKFWRWRRFALIALVTNGRRSIDHARPPMCPSL